MHSFNNSQFLELAGLSLWKMPSRNVYFQCLKLLRREMRVESWSLFQSEHPLLLPGPYQALEAEQRTFKLLLKMNIERVVSFPLLRVPCSLQWRTKEPGLKLLGGSQDGEERRCKPRGPTGSTASCVLTWKSLSPSSKGQRKGKKEKA